MYNCTPWLFNSSSGVADTTVRRTTKHVADGHLCKTWERERERGGRGERVINSEQSNIMIQWASTNFLTVIKYGTCTTTNGQESHIYSFNYYYTSRHDHSIDVQSFNLQYIVHTIWPCIHAIPRVFQRFTRKINIEKHGKAWVQGYVCTYNAQGP